MARTREPDRPVVPIPGPVRTCVGCRSRGSAPELLRVVVVAGALVPDPRRRQPGRGAWLHPDAGCLHRAERRSAFGRALRVEGPLDTTAVHTLLDAPSPPTGPTGYGTRRARSTESRTTPDEPAVKHSR